MFKKAQYLVLSFFLQCFVNVNTQRKMSNRTRSDLQAAHRSARSPCVHQAHLWQIRSLFQLFQFSKAPCCSLRWQVTHILLSFFPTGPLMQHMRIFVGHPGHMLTQKIAKFCLKWCKPKENHHNCLLLLSSSPTCTLTPPRWETELAQVANPRQHSSLHSCFAPTHRCSSLGASYGRIKYFYSKANTTDL